MTMTSTCTTISKRICQEGHANALALNKDCSQIAVAGRSLLKVYSIEPDGFVEACNMRGGKNQNLSYSSNDVAWSTIEHNLLATAATNGVISVWDLSKFGRQKQLYVFNEHERTAHTVTFHGTEPHLLISGSQDGTIKCFDLRCDKAVHTYCSNAESVRDVKFSPQQPHQFAAVSENGTVQLWDMKRPDRCQLQFTAHSGPVYTCDWHPTQPWLATGSRDRQIKVWRMDQKPALEYNIHTIAVVGRVKWRPERQHHIASCALVVDYSIYIWDVRRPYIPYASFTEHTNVTTGIAFKGNDPHVLMSASKDSTIFKHSFQDATRPTTKVNPQASCFNLNGDLLFAYKVKNVPGATGTTAPVPGELPASAGGALGGASGTGIAAGMAVSQSASMSASGNNSAASTCIGAVAAASAAAAVALPPSTPRSSGAGAFIADTISSVYSTPRAVSTAASAQSAAVIGQLPHEQFHLAKSRLLSYTADSWTNGSTTDATSHHNHHYHHQQQSQHHHPRPPAVSSSATGHHGHVGAIATVGMSHEFDAFRGCARDYILTGAQLSDICDYNADIARKYGKANVSMLWRFIGNQYANVALTYGGSGAGNAGSGAGVNADVTITQRNKSQAGCSNNGGTVVSGGIGSSPGGSNSIIAASSNANITGRLIHMLPGHNTNRQLSTATGALLATVTSTGSTVVGSGIASVATAGNTNSSTSTHAGSGVCQPESSSEQEVLVQMCCEDLKLQDFRHPKSGEFKHSSGTGGCSAAETTTNNSSSAHNTNDGSDGAQKTSIVTAVTPTVATASSAAAAAAEQELADQSADSLASFVHGDAEELTVHDVKGLRNGFLYIGPHDLTKGWSLPHNNLNELQTKKAAADMEAECRQQAEADGMVLPETPSVLKLAQQLPVACRRWLPHSVLADGLQLQTDIGDVQTSVCILIAMGERRAELPIDDLTLESWLLAYVELLHRHQLWSEAAEIINLAWLHSVRELNEQSTTMHTNCGDCGRPMSSAAGWYCPRCKSARAADCAVCNRPVRGLYAWCQGCSHGGHLEHMRQWFADHSKCPKCGHMCEHD